MKQLSLLTMFSALAAAGLASDDAQITFTTTTDTGQQTLWRVQAKPGAVPENLSARLDALASPSLAGSHSGPISVSPDGMWYVFKSERFDPDSQGWAGLTIARADFTSVETIRAGGQTIHGEGMAQATAGGVAVVYEDSGGPHTRDLFVVRRQGAAWSTPLLLTGQSTFAWHYWLSLSPDGTKVVFNAGADSYPSTAICEVRPDGTGFRVVVSRDERPAGSAGPSTEVHSPAYAPDGSLIFETDWDRGEQVWRIPAGGGTPTLVQSTFENDNSPAVLPDGRIASLWMLSATGDGLHELKVMDANGLNSFVLTSTNSPFSEVFDAGLGAGPLWAPLLAIRAAGHAVEISWPDRFTNVTVQTTAGLSGPKWSDLPTTTNRVLMPPTDAAQIFRLIRAP